MVSLTCSLLLAATAAIPAAPSAADLARLTPPDAQVVMGVNLTTLRSHPAVQAWLAEHRAPWTGRGGEGEELLREAGLDPLHDVDATVVAVVHRPAGNDAWLALFGGSFDPSSLAAALVKRGAELVPAAPFVLLRADKGERGAPFIALFDRLVAVGDEPSVLAAATGATMGAGVVRVERAAGRLDPTATLWLAVEVPPALRQRAQTLDSAPEAARALVFAARAVERLLLHARLADSLELAGWARADTPDNAELLNDAAKGLVAALRLTAQERQPDLVDVLRQVRITQREREVTGTATIPLAVIEGLVQSASRPNSNPTQP